MRSVSIYSVGKWLVTYRFPNIAVNNQFCGYDDAWFNLLLCEGYSIIGKFGADDFLERVRDAKKPVVSFYVPYNQIGRIELLIKKYDLVYDTVNLPEHEYMGFYVARPGTVAEVFDQSAVLDNYHDLLQSHMSSYRNSIKPYSNTLKFIKRWLSSHKDTSLISALRSYDCTNPDANHLPITGLLFGYPVQSTFALLVGQAKFPQWVLNIWH